MKTNTTNTTCSCGGKLLRLQSSLGSEEAVLECGDCEKRFTESAETAAVAREAGRILLTGVNRDTPLYDLSSAQVVELQAWEAEQEGRSTQPHRALDRREWSQTLGEFEGRAQ